MTRVIRLFPLPLVLFPKAVLPLHIFEPRYRKMVADCLTTDGAFGIICCPPNSPELDIAAGTVGCMARIESSQHLSDGRFNIMVIGTERFTFASFAQTDAPYYCAVAHPVVDSPSSTEVLAPLARRVRDVFVQVGHAARVLNDDSAPLPHLPEDPVDLAFAVAQFVDLELVFRQRLLSTRSAEARLSLLVNTLEPLAGGLEQGAQVHQRAKTNGHGPAATPP